MMTAIEFAEVVRANGHKITPGGVKWHARKGRIGTKIGRDWIFDPVKDYDQILPYLGMVGRSRISMRVGDDRG